MSEELKDITGNISAEANALNAAFDATNVQWKDRAATLAAFRREHEIVWEGGAPYSKYDNEVAPLSDCLMRYAFDAAPGEIDRRTLPREGVGTSRPSTLAKSEMTTAEKVTYIRERGEDAFAVLPLTPVHTSEIRTFEDFRKLPLAEKARLTSDPNYIHSLKPSPSFRQPGQAYIDHAALERQAAIRPASGRR